LASGSRSRAELLLHAGIPHIIHAPDIDENQIKKNARKDCVGVEIVVQRLALAKALYVAESYPDKFVLGCDQILDCDGVWFDKPKSMEQARSHIQEMSGKTHRLVNGLTIVHNGITVWTHTESASLSMRDISNAFLDDYINQSGEAILSTVGAYLLEARGVQLFDSIEGDYFTILGLPLLPIIAFLRSQNIVRS
jgi:septum formation protein